MTDEMKAKLFEALEVAEGYVRSAAYHEVVNPPYEHGKAHKDLRQVHEALAALQHS